MTSRASWRSSLVVASISCSSHSTPSVAPREGFHQIATADLLLVITRGRPLSLGCAATAPVPDY